MDLVHLPTVDSTSTHAAQLLAAGRPAPFAVWADAQTGGRGRRGNAWASLPGNLHLTLVLPPPPGGPAVHGGLPLKAGLVLARLVERSCGIRLTLKWPNDLLFAGRKIGGLLLEGSVSGQRAGEVLVGIGLNLNGTPALTGPYQATSLAAVLGRPLDVGAWTRRLVAEFADEWDAVPAAAVASAFEAYSLGAGQLWTAADGRLARAEAVRDDGLLPLTVLGSGTGGRQGDPPPTATAPLLLSSVDHGWRWLYQGEAPAPLAVADVGNSATKLAWFADARDPAPAATLVVEHGALLAPALCRLAAMAPAAPWPLHILSVQPAAAASLAREAAAVGLAPEFLPKRPVRRHGAGYVLAELGADRLAAIEGWLARQPAPHHPGQCGIVVAAGTATTVDAVTGDGRHLGGLILPGLATALASLHKATSLLPAVEFSHDRRVAGGLGHDTKSAMTQAVLEMTAGAVERLVRSLVNDQGLELVPDGVWVTGGWGRPLATVLGARYEDGLVLDGARIMVLGGLA